MMKPSKPTTLDQIVEEACADYWRTPIWHRREKLRLMLWHVAEMWTSEIKRSPAKHPQK